MLVAERVEYPFLVVATVQREIFRRPAQIAVLSVVPVEPPEFLIRHLT